MEPEELKPRPDPKDLVQGKIGAEATTELSEFRTGLSEHRTDLSENRTTLSEHRTELSDVRSHLANERTHLAYLRTGVSLISLGITLNRFSIFLLQSNLMTREGGRTPLRDAKNVGIGMVILGSALLAWSVFHFLQTATAIDTAKFKPAKWSVLIFTLAVIVTGTISAAWMILG